MPFESLKDGDLSFVGLNSRDNPSSLPQGIVSKSVNFRMDRGIASVRLGSKRLKTYPETETVYGVGKYVNASGQDVIIMALADKFRFYNIATNTYSTQNYGATLLTTQDGVDVVYALGKIFVTRGHNTRPFMFDTATNITTVLPVSAGTGHEFPSPNGLMYYCNRLVALARHHISGFSARNCVSVSNFLQWDKWDALDEFVFNEQGNDSVVSVSPWTINEFLVFCRNSIYYVNLGIEKYVTGDPLGQDSFIRTLVTDIGCSAKNTIVQANGGLLFLSDNGVYFLQPQSVGSNESIKLLTVSDPVSSPVDDIIKRINKTYAYRSVAAYWNNRYYLAVPLDNSQYNNVVLVYNFILKQWESLDTYPNGLDIIKWVTGIKDNQIRLFGVDTDEGILLMEELLWDEWGDAQGTPKLNFRLSDDPATAPILTLSDLQYEPYPINAELITRKYTFNTVGDKRFSTVESEFNVVSGSQIISTSIVSNPDTNTIIDDFVCRTTGDEARRNPVRKIGTGMQVKYESDSYSTSIRNTFVYAKQQNSNNINKK